MEEVVCLGGDPALLPPTYEDLETDQEGATRGVLGIPQDRASAQSDDRRRPSHADARPAECGMGWNGIGLRVGWPGEKRLNRIPGVLHTAVAGHSGEQFCDGVLSLSRNGESGGQTGNRGELSPLIRNA